MKTLEQQLADYGERQRELHGPISVEELTVRLNHLDQVSPVRPLHPVPQPVRYRRHQNWLVTVGTAAAVLVLVGAAALLFRATGTQTPVATTPPIVSSSSLSWSRVPHDEAAFGEAGMARATAGGPGLVAVGSAERSSLQAVWTSVDGNTWSRVPHHESFDQGAWMHDVTAGGPGLVVVGGSDWWCEDGCEGDAAVWTSADGTTWSRVPHDESVFGGTGAQSMLSVTVGGPGLVAVGAVGWDSAAHMEGDAAVWTSVDGTTWSRVPHDEAVFGGTGVQTMESVTAGGPGFVAVGEDESRPWPPRTSPPPPDRVSTRSAAIWTSVDGVTWSRVPHDESLFGGASADSVTVGGPGLVAVGDDGQSAVVWTSVDGITWSRVPHDDAMFGGEPLTRMRVVTVGGPGLVAVGDEGWREGGPEGMLAIWTSIDGITWTRVPDDDATFGGSGPSGFAAWGSGLIAVGGNDREAAVWILSEGTS